MTTVVDFFRGVGAAAATDLAAVPWWAWPAGAVVAGLLAWAVNARVRQHDQSRIDNEGDPL